MGRPPCCDKVGIKKGPWTPEEDIILVSYIQEHGPGNWRAVPTNTGLMRCSKSCRLRWTNYLRPGIKRGNFTPHEEGMIIHLQALLGNKWAAIATYLPQRTDNDIKNYWNTHLKKKLKKFQSGLEAPPQMAGSDHHSSSANNYHQFMSKKYSTDNQRVAATTSFENNIVNSKNNSSVYASSAENISRLLEGWMRSSSISDIPTQANTNSSTSSHQLYENRDFGKINNIPINDHQCSELGGSGSVLQCYRPQQIDQHEGGANGINNPAHDHELECILSFDHHNLTTSMTGCDKSSCDSSQKGSDGSSGTFMDNHEKGTDHFMHENKPKIDNHNSNPPLSFLEKWLLDESAAGQVEMEIPSIF